MAVFMTPKYNYGHTLVNDSLETVSVETPVTRHPLHRSRHAAFPHQALQSYSLSQSATRSCVPPIPDACHRHGWRGNADLLQHPWGSFAVRFPVALKALEGEAVASAGPESTESPQMGLVFRYLQAKFL